MAISQRLFPSGAVEVMIRRANTAPKDDIDFEFLLAAKEVAERLGFQNDAIFERTDARDMSRVFAIRFDNRKEAE